MKKIIFKIIEFLKEPYKLLLFLDNKKILRLDDKFYLKLMYKKNFNTDLNLENPKTFNEKMQWLKLYDRNEKYSLMVDKYEAKNYVKKIIGEEYIIPTIDVWNKFEDIDFSKLPQKFVLKCTHDSGGLVICRNKKDLNYKDVKKRIKKSLQKNFFYSFREWPYKNVKPRIIAEKYMENSGFKDLVDYKFFCFNGEPKFIYVSSGLENHSTARIDFLDINYEKVGFKRKDYRSFDEIPAKPKNFEKMKELAACLSKDITFLRVDFYEIEGKIYFSELTFFPCAGYVPFDPEEYDKN